MERGAWVLAMLAVPVAWGQTQQAIFFSGNVMLDDGTPPADAVSIERVCNGMRKFETWTDAKGHFSFKIAPNANDAETGDAAAAGPRPSDVNKPLNANATQYSMPITSELRDCELHAVLAGYRSESVSMAIKSMMDDARVGTIILHPISRAGSLSVSATTLEAPASARKAYEKGLEEIRVQKWDAAATDLGKAVKIYPRFAVAWYQLGLARQSRNDAAGAVEAWKQSRASDPHFIKPYENLTAAADGRGDWADSEKYSRQWIALDPEDFPGAYLFNAVANARLNKPEDAEHAAREGVRLDKDGHIPRLQFVLGLILMDKKQYGESVQCFHKYLELAPNAHDAPAVRQQLSKLEALAGGQSPQ